ncbi:hypothetical protein EDC01DRAFT_758378 [Geopyxis carbonaria]|nr:hypothetical protein EDC01DRAFT_758378 [Geopyxis carbonaria]
MDPSPLPPPRPARIDAPPSLLLRIRRGRRRLPPCRPLPHLPPLAPRGGASPRDRSARRRRGRTRGVAGLREVAPARRVRALLPPAPHLLLEYNSVGPSGLFWAGGCSATRCTPLTGPWTALPIACHFARPAAAAAADLAVDLAGRSASSRCTAGCATTRPRAMKATVVTLFGTCVGFGRENVGRGPAEPRMGLAFVLAAYGRVWAYRDCTDTEGVAENDGGGRRGSAVRRRTTGLSRFSWKTPGFEEGLEDVGGCAEFCKQRELRRRGERGLRRRGGRRQMRVQEQFADPETYQLLSQLARDSCSPAAGSASFQKQEQEQDKTTFPFLVSSRPSTPVETHADSAAETWG